MAAITNSISRSTFHPLFHSSRTRKYADLSETDAKKVIQLIQKNGYFEKTSTDEAISPLYRDRLLKKEQTYNRIYRSLKTQLLDCERKDYLSESQRSSIKAISNKVEFLKKRSCKENGYINSERVLKDLVDFYQVELSKLSPPLPFKMVSFDDIANVDLLIKAHSYVVEKNLVKIWPKLRKTLPEDISEELLPDPLNGESIRQWFNNGDNLSYLQNIIDLNLFNFKLTYLPEEICKLTNLRNLNLCLNKLSTLPDNMESLRTLRGLYLDYNFLTYLPINLGSLKALRNLGLYYNKLTILPDNFGALVNLKNLYLSNNELTTLPDSFVSLINLRNLHLDNNPLVTLSSS